MVRSTAASRAAGRAASRAATRAGLHGATVAVAAAASQYPRSAPVSIVVRCHGARSATHVSPAHHNAHDTGTQRHTPHGATQISAMGPDHQDVWNWQRDGATPAGQIQALDGLVFALQGEIANTTFNGLGSSTVLVALPATPSVICPPGELVLSATHPCTSQSKLNAWWVGTRLMEGCGIRSSYRRPIATACTCRCSAWTCCIARDPFNVCRSLFSPAQMSSPRQSL